MKTYVLVTNKSWHDSLFENLKTIENTKWVRIRNAKEFSKKKLDRLKPHKIFIPHWSTIIPPDIYENFNCIVFHMTNLPYGRGGSPLQNLIVRGHTTTKISAIEVAKGIDTGNIYLKKSLSLKGSAHDIFLRAAKIIENMIVQLITVEHVPEKQKGKVVTFKRRTPEQGNLKELSNLHEIYDYIRMLDCEGYPPAFIDIGNFRIEFNNASFEKNKIIKANVRITTK